MGQTEILESLRDGTAPRHLRILAARGLAPLPPRESIDLLVCLAVDPDPEIALEASRSLKNLPEDEILNQLRQRDCSPRVLEYFATASRSDAILESIAMNSATPGGVVAKMAVTASSALLETILYNRVRLLECPEILKNIKLNPCSTGEVRRLVQEIEVEFFSRRKNQYSIEENTSTSPVVETPELETEPAPEDLSLEGLPLDPEARESAILQRLGRMTVRDKIRYALLGTREARVILVRDPNKEVSRSVLQSPKLSESEVEVFAAMRSVSEDVLRELGNSREWTRNYTVVCNLAKNPKTPPTISNRLLSRLLAKDLKLLAQDRSVPEAVRRNAQRALSQRSAAKSSL